MCDIQNKEYYNTAYSVRKEYDTPYMISDYYFLWDEVIEYIDKKDYILELGCGTGQFAQMLFDNKYTRYTGVDFSNVAIEKAKKKTDYKFYVNDILDADSYKYVYNVIVALEVLEHTHDLRVIGNIRSGVDIVFTVPNFDDPDHIRHFNSEQEIYNRYSDYIDFKFIKTVDKYYICKGVVK